MTQLLPDETTSISRARGDSVRDDTIDCVPPRLQSVSSGVIAGRNGDSPTISLTNDPDTTDDALLTAAERARQAEKRFVEATPEDPAIVSNAEGVYQRAEEIDDLAHDAAESDTAEGLSTAHAS